MPYVPEIPPPEKPKPPLKFPHHGTASYVLMKGMRHGPS